MHGGHALLSWLLCAVLFAAEARGRGAVARSSAVPPVALLRHRFRRPCLLFPSFAGSLRLSGGGEEKWELGENGRESCDEDVSFPTLGEAAVARASVAGGARGMQGSEEEESPEEGGDDLSSGGVSHEDGDGTVDCLWDVTQGEGVGLWSGLRYATLRHRTSGVAIELARDSSALSFIFYTHTGSEVRAYLGSGTQDGIAFVASECCPRLLRTLVTDPGAHPLALALTPHAHASAHVSVAQRHVFGEENGPGKRRGEQERGSGGGGGGGDCGVHCAGGGDEEGEVRGGEHGGSEGPRRGEGSSGRGEREHGGGGRSDGVWSVED